MRIAAVIPVYNGEAFLRTAIESVLAQTSPVDELVILDDGSTDNTRAVALSYGQHLRYIFQENRGLAAARNAGAAASTCGWVAFLDCDDWWLPDKIAKQRALIESNPDAVLIYSDQWECESAGKMLYIEAVPPQQLWPQLRTRNGLSSSVAIVRRDALTSIGGYDEGLRACEDWDFYVRLHAKGPFAYIAEPLAVYRLSPGTMSTNADRMLQNFEAILESTLLKGLQGWSRILWRRRARSRQLLSAGLIARKAGQRDQERAHLWRSVLQWPSPFWEPRRYAALAVTMLRHSID
jgi:glycosyltransferase involved in cell wall biosynthesis